MPFWSGEKLEEEVKNCIAGEYNSDNIDCAAYTLHVGPEVFVTPDHYESNPSKKTKETLEEKEAFNIPSGQFAFLLTEEMVNISDKCVAFISMKASTKFKGLVNVSGFHVDPGYKGRLVFSVFNAGPAPIKLQRGMPLFLMWLADLDRKTTKLKNNAPVTELDLKIIAPIHGPIFSPQEISESVKSFKTDFKEALHKVETKVSNILLLASLIITALIALAAVQYGQLADEIDMRTKIINEMNIEKSISTTPHADTN